MMGKKKLFVIGTVGLPATYGGWETLVDNIVERLSIDFDVTVYCSSREYDQKVCEYKEAKLVYLPLKANGIQSIPYDILSMIHCCRAADTVLVLGVSGCIFLPIFRRLSSARIVTNIDGIEWKRDKWGTGAKRFLRFSERIAVKYSDVVVADNEAIKKYLLEAYKSNSPVIEYGGDHARSVEFSVARDFNLNGISEGKYAFTVCRIEPENNVHLILEALSKVSNLPYVIIGNWCNSEYGRQLKRRYEGIKNLYLLDPIYDSNLLGGFRSNAGLYIHGHSCGGTNPSLVEAMYLGLPVIAYDVAYNRETTENEAVYFANSDDLVEKLKEFNFTSNMASRMKSIADRRYRWNVVADKYISVLK